MAFSVALGILVGGSLAGGTIAALTSGLPARAALALAERLKLWAMVAALGGTFDTLRALESGVFGGHLGLVARQLLLIGGAFAGAHSGYLLVHYWVSGR